MGTVMYYSIEERNLAISKGKMLTGHLHHYPAVDMETLIDLMSNKNTTITRQDILGVMDLFHEVVTEKLAEGCRVSTPLFRAGLSLRGEFNSKTDKIDYQKHTLRVTMQPAKGLTEKITNDIRLHRKRDRKPTFAVDYIKNMSTGKAENAARAGDVVELRGTGLKVYHCDADYTVEYYPGIKPTAESTVIRLTGSRAVTVIPAGLKPGEYKVCFVKKYNGVEYRTPPVTLTVQK